jgi:hypothetical protein
VLPRYEIARFNEWFEYVLRENRPSGEGGARG